MISRRLGGSIFEEVTSSSIQTVPDIDDIEVFETLFNAVQELIQRGWIIALHDISDGGLFTTLAELSFTNKIGIEILFQKNFQNDAELQYLFAEETGVVVQFHNDFEEQALEFLKAKKPCNIKSVPRRDLMPRFHFFEK